MVIDFLFVICVAWGCIALVWLAIDSLSVGTKSVLFGAHCFLLHPWFAALAWRKLYGFPCDLRQWVAFIVHDLGYIGKPNMDGPEGETHPVLGARIMHALFDHSRVEVFREETCIGIGPYFLTLHPGERLERFDCDTRVATIRGTARSTHWRDFSLLHSRYYAKRLDKPFSRLCVADKLAFALTPRWLYLPMVNATGEIREYLKMAKNADAASGHWKAADYSAHRKAWHIELCRYMRSWVAAHHDGTRDTWTSTDRHARTDSGVWQ